MLILLAGCQSMGANNRMQMARAIAGEENLTEQKLEATPFRLTSFARIEKYGSSARIYIEGDGLAWLGKRRVSPDPTPTDPIALRLAAKDSSANVVYLARPCQYSGLDSTWPCPAKYWTSHRFAPEVIEAYTKALDDLKARHDLTGFELVGFSGGGAIAVLVAARRDDIISLRTVAGNLDHALVNANHKVSPLHGSLNPVDVAGRVASVPQLHLMGGQDRIITPDIYKSFRQKAGDTNCLQARLIETVSHEKGWAEVWSEILRQPVKCRTAQE